MQNIKDIKPFIELNDYSFYLLIITIIVGLLLAYFIFKKTYTRVIENCKIDCQKYYLYRLKTVDWSLPKVAAYEATYYGRLLAQDKRRKELFLQMKNRLDILKYSKDNVKVDAEIMKYYNLYKQVCDESI
jgi:hypothetical protein